MARIDHEVDEHLLQLARVHAHHAGIGIEVRLQGDPLSDEPPQHPFQIVHADVQVEVDGLGGLLAAEGQEPPGELRGPFRRGLDLLDGFCDLGPFPGVAAQLLSVAQDHREQVVEVVGDAAGQLAHGLHLLGLVQGALGLRERLLGTLLLRDARLDPLDHPGDARGHHPRHEQEDEGHPRPVGERGHVVELDVERGEPGLVHRESAQEQRGPRDEQQGHGRAGSEQEPPAHDRQRIDERGSREVADPQQRDASGDVEPREQEAGAEAEAVARHEQGQQHEHEPGQGAHHGPPVVGAHGRHHEDHHPAAQGGGRQQHAAEHALAPGLVGFGCHVQGRSNLGPGPGSLRTPGEARAGAQACRAVHLAGGS
jgi:hypothetical protein